MVRLTARARARPVRWGLLTPGWPLLLVSDARVARSEPKLERTRRPCAHNARRATTPTKLASLTAPPVAQTPTSRRRVRGPALFAPSASLASLAVVNAHRALRAGPVRVATTQRFAATACWRPAKSATPAPSRRAASDAACNMVGFALQCDSRMTRAPNAATAPAKRAARLAW